MVAEAATTGATQAAPETSLRRVREVDMVCPLFRWGDVFVARMREPAGLRPDAEEKHTLNLSFNINLRFRFQQKAEKATAPPPSSSLCRYRAPKPRTY